MTEGSTNTVLIRGRSQTRTKGHDVADGIRPQAANRIQCAGWQLRRGLHVRDAGGSLQRAEWA